ncbi:hypothetical protein H8356DRAFT_1638540 [Neocallimastix lanati (nom. inval.)]|nr:hypothetical protein H8356DRAFT_1638540 [Neocallimastix sp. JGI-2020a]
MMFFKEFWRYKNYYRALNKNQLIHNTDDTLNIEKLQAQSQISDYDPQNMSFKNLKMFFNIKKIFSNESKRSTIGETSTKSCTKEVQPSYVVVNMTKEYSMDDDSSTTSELNKKTDTLTADRQSISKKTYDTDDYSMKKSRKSVDEHIINNNDNNSSNNNNNSNKDDVERSSLHHKNSISENDKNNKMNMKDDASINSNISETMTQNNWLQTKINKNECNSMDLKTNNRLLNRIEEISHTNSPNNKVRSHIDIHTNYNNMENENLAKILLNEKSNFKSDRGLERPMPVRNNSNITSNLRYNNDSTSGFSSEFSMANHRTMCNVNQTDSMDNTRGSTTDGIMLKSSMLSKSVTTQTYCSHMDLEETRRMLDSDIFRNVGQERHLYDKKTANVKLHNFALQIYDKYICHGSIYELNIRDKTIKDISNQINNSTNEHQPFSEDIFNQAYIEVLQNIYMTSFQKFLKYGKEDILYCSSLKREEEDDDNEGESNKIYDFNY